MAIGRKNIFEGVVVAALLIVLGFSVIRTLASLKPAKSLQPASVPKSVSAKSLTASPPESSSGAVKLQEPLGEAPPDPAPMGTTYRADTLRDPLVSLLPSEHSLEAGTQRAHDPEQEPSSPSPQVVVQGLIWGGERPQAVINGEVYDVGDTIEGARIVSISGTGVTMDVAGSTLHVAPAKDRSRAVNQRASRSYDTPGRRAPLMHRPSPEVTTRGL